jgi:hypothetical protein
MAYKPTEALAAQVAALRSAPAGRSYASGLAQGLREMRANQLGRKYEEQAAENERIKSIETQRLVQALSGTQIPMREGMSQNYQTPEINALVAELAAKKSLNQADIQARSQFQAPSEMPSNIREWEYYSQLPKDQQEQYLTMRRGSSPINLGNEFVIPSAVNPAEAPRASFPISLSPGELPTTRGAQTAAVQQAEIDAIPVRADAELQAQRQAQQSQRIATADTKEAQFKLMDEMIDKAKGQAGFWTTGFGADTLSQVGGTPAADLAATLDSIQATVGFDKLQEMRENSPTGGALGSVTERELALLQATFGSLKQSQSRKQFEDNLEVVRRQIKESWERVAEAYQRDYGTPYFGDEQDPFAEADAILRGLGL